MSANSPVGGGAGHIPPRSNQNRPPPSSDIAISVQSVAKKFRIDGHNNRSVWSALTGFHRTNSQDFWALRDVSVDVPRGSMLGIIGKNGSGKSTLLRLMCGVYRPTEGQIDIHGRITALLELGAGFHQELSGRENIFMNAAVMGMPRDRAAEAIEDIVGLADIGDFIDQPVEIYSSGMRARLGFAVSVFLDPEILLADEIISVGDVGFAKKCFEHLNRMRREGVTTVLVTHNLAIMENMCDQVAWIHKGETQALGNPIDVVRQYRDFMTGGVNPDEPAAPTSGITHMEATSQDGLEMGYTGAPLTVRAGFDLEDPIEEPQLQLQVHALDGPIFLGAAGPNDLGPILKGRGQIEYHIPMLPVGPGRYSVEIEITSAVSDASITQRCPLPIRPAQDHHVTDFYDIGGDWTVTTD